MPEIAKVHHISRETTDVERSAAFYRDVLGFEPIPRPDLGFAGAWLARAGVQIHLIKGTPPERDRGEIRTRADHVAFHTNDVAAFEAHLTENQIPYRRNVQASTGLVQLFFQDPDGNYIEISCYTS